MRNFFELMEKYQDFKKFIIVAIVAVLLTVIVGGTLIYHAFFKKQPEIVTTSSLERIINISELSTYTVTYNGVSTVIDDEKPENVKYHVSYEAKAKVGLDFEKVMIEINKELHKVNIRLPKLHITDVNVDIASLDYIFIDKKANASTVSEEAYKQCIADVNKEVEQETAIYDLGKVNAENVIRALVQPFLEQSGEDYMMKITWEE